MMSWDDEWREDYCEKCDKMICPSTGKGDILIVGYEPEKRDIEVGIPFSGRSGQILRKMFRYRGYNLTHFRSTYLWKHGATSNDKCFTQFKKELAQEALTAKLILLIGKELSDLYLNKNISDVCGITLSSPALSAPLIPIQNINTIFSQGIGEIDLALQKFFALVEELQ